jgi:RimJ/RimL family protein N-acetyltransferase
MTAAGDRRADVTLRPATEGDSDLLRFWRNDPEAVRFSGTARTVSAEEHRDWLAARMVDPATRLWIAELESTPVGQVRIDLEEGVATVSIAVAPGHRGRGLGTAVLRAMVTEVEVDPRVTRLRALAHAENVASVRAFERVGFSAQGRGPGGFVILERSVGAHR